MKSKIFLATTLLTMAVLSTGCAEVETNNIAKNTGEVITLTKCPKDTKTIKESESFEYAEMNEKRESKKEKEEIMQNKISMLDENIPRLEKVKK